MPASSEDNRELLDGHNLQNGKGDDLTEFEPPNDLMERSVRDVLEETMLDLFIRVLGLIGFEDEDVKIDFIDKIGEYFEAYQESLNLKDSISTEAFIEFLRKEKVDSVEIELIEKLAKILET